MGWLMDAQSVENALKGITFFQGFTLAISSGALVSVVIAAFKVGRVAENLSYELRRIKERLAVVESILDETTPAKVRNHRRLAQHNTGEREAL